MESRCPRIIFAGREKEAGDKPARQWSRRLIIMLQHNCLLNARGSVAQKQSLHPQHVATIFSWPRVGTCGLAESISFLLIPLRDLLICEFL